MSRSMILVAISALSVLAFLASSDKSTYAEKKTPSGEPQGPTLVIFDGSGDGQHIFAFRAAAYDSSRHMIALSPVLVNVAQDKREVETAPSGVSFTLTDVSGEGKELGQYTLGRVTDESFHFTIPKEFQNTSKLKVTLTWISKTATGIRGSRTQTSDPNVP